MKILYNNLILPVLKFIKAKNVLDINFGDYEYSDTFLSYFLDNNIKLTLVNDSPNIQKKGHENISFLQNLSGETIIKKPYDCILINYSHISEVNLNRLKNIFDTNKIINPPLIIMYDIESTNNTTLEIVNHIINQKNYNMNYHIFNTFYNLGILHPINKKLSEFIIKQCCIAQNLIIPSNNTVKNKTKSELAELKERNTILSTSKQEQYEKLVKVQSDNQMLADRLKNLEKEYLTLNKLNEDSSKLYWLLHRSKVGFLILNDFEHTSEKMNPLEKYNSMVLFNHRLVGNNNYLKKKNQELSKENQELRNALNSFKNSRSWKYTSSLRNINNKLGVYDI